MSDLLIKAFDQAIFNPVFGAAIVEVQPGTIFGTGVVLIDGVIACALGDETSVVVGPCKYITLAYNVTPGAGMIMIDRLNQDQIAQKTTFVGRPAILKGTTFFARFMVMGPAGNPALQIPTDPILVHNGTGRFETTNFRSKGF